MSFANGCRWLLLVAKEQSTGYRSIQLICNGYIDHVIFVMRLMTAANSATVVYRPWLYRSADKSDWL